MNSNAIIIVLLTVLVMVGIYFIMDKKDQPTVIKETIKEVEKSAPADDGSSIELKLNRVIKL